MAPRPFYDGRTILPLMNVGRGGPVRLGQALTPPAPPSPSVEIGCYRCGTQPPRAMTASVAAMVPGGCVKVDASECGLSSGSTSAPTPSGATGTDGPTYIKLAVFDPTTLDGLAGAKVTVEARPITEGSTINVPSPLIPPAGAAVQVMGSGQTNADGIFVYQGSAPSPNRAYFFRLTVEPGPNTASFPKKFVDVPTRTAYAIASGQSGYLSVSAVSITVAPSNVDPLVTAVAEAQVQFAAIMAQCEVAWGSSAQGKSFCADQAHANVQLNHPKLREHWDTFSWWIGDFSIAPKDWPKLIANFEQTTRIYNTIPFPKLPEAEDLWYRCARGIPIWKGMGIANPRFYVSDYFPREDRKIEADFAAQFMINVPATVACLEHKIKQKAKEIARSAKAWRMMGLVSVVMLAPLAAGASMSLIVTELADFAYQSITGNVVPGAVSAIATGGVSIAAAGLSSDAIEQLVTAGLTLLMQQYGEDLDPIVQKIISGATPKIASAAVTDLAAGTTTVSDTAASGAGDFISLSTIGSAAAAMAVKMVGNMISATGVRSVDDFKKTILGLNTLPTLMVPFIVWAINVLLLDKLFDQAAAMGGEPAEGGTVPPAPGTTPPAPGTVPPPPGTVPPATGDAPVGDLDMGTDVIDPLVDQAESEGVEVPYSSTEIRDPVLSSGPSAGTLLAAGGITAGAIVAALAIGGVFGK